MRGKNALHLYSWFEGWRYFQSRKILHVKEYFVRCRERLTFYKLGCVAFKEGIAFKDNIDDSNLFRSFEFLLLVRGKLSYPSAELLSYVLYYFVIITVLRKNASMIYLLVSRKLRKLATRLLNSFRTAFSEW